MASERERGEKKALTVIEQVIVQTCLELRRPKETQEECELKETQMKNNIKHTQAGELAAVTRIVWTLQLNTPFSFFFFPFCRGWHSIRGVC